MPGGRVGRFLSLPRDDVGRQVEPASVRGYPLDFTAAAGEPAVPRRFLEEPGRHLWGGLAACGLGCYERWLAGDGEEWLAGARAVADFLLERQTPDGGWVQTAPYPHTFVVRPPWVSGLGQGEGASLLVRVHLETGEDRYAEAALRALRPMSVPSAEGGVRALLDGRAFPEEYPTDPPSFVLNGGIFAMWGQRDVAVGLGDAGVWRQFEQSVDTLAANIHRWDSGSWSLYDLFPHRVANVASPAYHDLHVKQLEATHALAPHPELKSMVERFVRYRASLADRAAAFARKGLFRVVVPRSTRMAALAPWARAPS
jgi:heparosan-N-sulfate-glucuronate 5-epimerase